MWIFLFIMALIFVLGTALLLLRSANVPKLPKNVKPQPYDDEPDSW